MKKVAALSFLFAALVACERDVSSNTGVRGVVLLGPMCPVVNLDSPCPDEPIPSMNVEVTQNGDVVATVVTDAQGRFEVALEPGTYELRAVLESPGPPFARPVSATVPSSGYAQVDVSVDSGIR